MMLPLHYAKLVRIGLQEFSCGDDIYDTTCAMHIKWTYFLICIATTAFSWNSHSSFWCVISSLFELFFEFVKQSHCMLFFIFVLFIFYFLTFRGITYKGNMDNLKSQIYIFSNVFLEALILRKTVR
jgi:hypothetical protein